PRGAARTRREGQAPGGPLMRLPAVLGERYAVVAELPVQGAESDLLLVRDDRGDEYVVKVFRSGYRADREVWAKLPALDAPNVLHLLETGHADGRDYEVAAYAPDGNLRTLMEEGPLPWETAGEVAAQLAAGLGALHRAGIVHRDLKPENVLVLGKEPVRLAIADFGLSKVLDQSVVFASSSRTLAYAAPESLSGQVSPARDWWSLGMIVRELATGRAPFQGLSETVVVDHLATRPVSADDVPEPRLRLLCQGLLTRDPRKRWTGEQVQEWLDGGSPHVAEDTVPAESGPGLPFRGHRYTDRAELARALVENWDHAARYFFGRGETGEAWRSLREWLAEIPDDSRIALVDGRLTTHLPPDVKIAHLVRWLDPSMPPHFLGRRITAGDLPGLAALARDQHHPDHRTACLIGRALWEHGVLHVLADFEGGEELARVDDQWRAHVSAWNDLARWLREQNATPPGLAMRLPDAGVEEPPAVLLALLALAARPAETHRLIAEGAARARASVPEPVPWFTWMTDGAGDDPLRLLAIAQAAPEAAAESESRTRERHAAGQRDDALRTHHADRERQRLAGRDKATMKAVAATLPLLFCWLLGSWIVGSLFGGDDDGTASVGLHSSTSGAGFGVLAVVSLVAWAVECGAEVLVARAQGTEYLPHGPWAMIANVLGASGRGLSTASHTVSGAARMTGRRGCGCLLVAAAVPMFLFLLLIAAVTSVASVLWALALIVVAAAHAVAAGVRLHQWRQARSIGGTP
ncbi:serine/threonine protein kinase, partial [Actinomadura darangshiensis]